MLNTQRGRSRAQHVRDREADIESANNWRLVHLRRSKGEARRAEPTFGLCFSCKGGERGQWRGPKGRADASAVLVLSRKDYRAARPVADEPIFVAFDQKHQILAHDLSP